MEQKPKGAGLLNVTGILMIIGGALSLILSIVAVLGVALLIAANIGTALLYVAGILTLVSAVAELVAGIIGVHNSKKPEKAGVCIAWGIVVIALSVIGAILTVAGGSSFPTVSFLIGLVLPVLYIIGAVLNKKA